jgi:hypothetical protein
MTPVPAFAILEGANQPRSETMRAVILHVPIPDRSRVQSGYRDFVKDLGNLNPGEFLAENVWLLSPTNYASLEPQLLRLVNKHATSFAIREAELADQCSIHRSPL